MKDKRFNNILFNVVKLIKQYIEKIVTKAKQDIMQYITDAIYKYNERTFVKQENLEKSIKDFMNKKAERKFKPNLLAYLWTQNTVDANGLRTVAIEKSKIDKWLEQFKESGIDGIEICQHIGFNKTTRNLYYMTNLETIDYVISKCKELGLKTPIIKLHQKFNLAQVKYLFANTNTKEDNLYNIDIQKASINEFKRQYNNMVVELCARYKNDIEYMSCFNENQHYWDREIVPKTQDTSATDTTQVPEPLYEADFPSFVVELINTIQSYGIKSGVSTAGIKDLNTLNTSIWSTFDSVDMRIVKASDCFFFNL